MVVFGQNWLYMAKCLYSAEVVIFGQNGCILKKVVVFGKTWLYSGKSGCNRAKVFVFGQSGCSRAKVVVFGQKLLYSGRVVVFV